MRPSGRRAFVEDGTLDWSAYECSIVGNYLLGTVLDPRNEFNEKIRVVTIEPIESFSKLEDHFVVLDVKSTVARVGNAYRNWEFRSVKRN